MCYMLGDYNIHLLNVDSLKSTSYFNDTLFNNECVFKYTKDTKHDIRKEGWKF